MINKDLIIKYSEYPDAFNIEAYEKVNSTNTVAKDKAALSFPEFSVIIAESQTSGRGRLGRSFYSPVGTGIYMSIILKPKCEKTALITSAAAVFCAQAIEKCFNLYPKIKWVNDLYLKGRKVCGILTESKYSASPVPDFTVLGIGMNVYSPQSGFPRDIEATAGFILSERVDGAREMLCAEILNNLYKNYVGIFTSRHMDEYRKRCPMIGETVSYSDKNGEKSGKILEIDDDCALILQTDGEKSERLYSGEVNIIKKTVEKLF